MGGQVRANTLREAWSRGECAINGWLLSPSMLGAEHMGCLEWDSLLIDLQHGAVDYRAAYGLCVALSARRPTPIARVPANEPAMIGRLLDAGIYGLMCPMVESRAEAEAFVRSCRYPPDGARSFGPVRAAIDGGAAEYFARANDEVITLAQIETARALENLQEIVQTPGLDAIYIGSADLSISLRGPAAIDYADPDTAARHREIIAVAKDHGVRVGMHALSEDDVGLAVAWGADLISLSSDLGLMVQGASQLLARARARAAGGSRHAGDGKAEQTPTVGALGGEGTPYDGASARADRSVT